MVDYRYIPPRMLRMKFLNFLFFLFFFRAVSYTHLVVDNWTNNPDSQQYIVAGKQLFRQIVELKVNVPMIGASGAIFGILLAFGMLFPNTELYLMFIPIPIKAKYFVLGYGLLELFLGMQNRDVYKRQSQRFAPYVHEGNVIPLSNEFERAYSDISRNGNAKIIFTDLCIKVMQNIRPN